ncbi:MAG: DUF4980 domain-containing protein [Candidatus Amulumruptor caecigallinarius]|nr:DUF4980 domain-containing protein [Candidatus Amulumruptor caecigallinarius]MCM1397740.1 DUF4980 domain-containing protein [Candidatus Amulumruptor caecigallinarius]MCM1453175.1 DUF4980 domain-containing protein [bacterium]
MNLIKRIAPAVALVSVAALPAMASDGVKVERLGSDHTLVRVTGEGRYLLLPVQETNDDATVNLLIDGKPEQTFYVRLAKTDTDYTVPFDLEPYKGHNVVLSIVTPRHHSPTSKPAEYAAWEGLALADSFDTTNTEQYRPAYHHTPLYGWMNDPNGMFYKDGLWHLYYQWNPYGSKWQNMTWGHSTSSDLVNWEHHPAAIEPNGLGSVFSGSSAIDSEGSAGFGKDAVVALYTSAGNSQMQSLAWSDDNGQTFNIYPGNPVLTLKSEARDPNFWWDAGKKEWVLVLAHALDHEMLIFTSPDLKEWTLQSKFGQGLGAQGGVWECPDFFELPVEGSDVTKWVMICNINPGGPFGGSGIQYFTGDFDGKRFTADTDATGFVPTKWLDFGKDNYALVSWNGAPDGRRTTLGWMSNWQYAGDVPTQQFRSANTLPRDIELFRAADGEVYAASVPVPELLAMRGKVATSAKSVEVGAKGRSFALPTANDGICEVTLDLLPDGAETVTLTFANAKGEKVTLIYAPKEKKLTFDRRNSGLVNFSPDFPAMTSAPTFGTGSELALRIFIDRSSMEVFTDGGRSVMTNLVFPTEPYTTLTVTAGGGKAQVRDLKIYEIKLP